MLNAFYYGLLANSALILGGLLGIWLNIGKRPLGLIMAFGAGVLISAVAYELILEAVRQAYGSGAVATGIFAGALTFFFMDRLIEKFSGSERMTMASSAQSAFVVPIVLAIILDGIPESTVIGMSTLGGDAVSLAMLVAVFISGLPEAIAGTAGMRSGGWSAKKILLLWLIIALVCALAAPAGYIIVGNVSKVWLAFIEAFAAGAILMMLANAMMPEAYSHGGKLAGLFTVLGFSVSVMVVLLERA